MMLAGRTSTILGLALLAPWFTAVQARSQWGEACSTNNNRLDSNTYAFISDCDAQLYCADNSTCAYKGCRRDIFPYGYNYVPFDRLPPLCPEGQFCPDEGSHCMPQVASGESCQKDRDDQCTHPTNWRDLSGWLNTNGSICLNFTCEYANTTLGQTCIVDNTRYTGYTDDGQEYAYIVSRDDCANGLYCDGVSRQCLRSKLQGAACDGNKECLSYNCHGNGTCARPADDPIHPPVYSFALVGVGIVVVIVGVFVGLWFVHRKQRGENQRRLEQYWNEQVAYRQSIMSMSHAKKSLMGEGHDDSKYLNDTPNPDQSIDPDAFRDADGQFSPQLNQMETMRGNGHGNGIDRDFAVAPELLHSPVPESMRRGSEAQWSEGGSEVLLMSPELDAGARGQTRDPRSMPSRMGEKGATARGWGRI